MAKEQVITLKTGDAVKNVQDLRNNIKLLKEQLADSSKTFEENQAAVKALRENQAALRQAMYATGDSISKVMSEASASNVVWDENGRLVKAETVSYNELVRQMDILKQQWRATTDEAERAKLGDRINQVNNRLKDMDASVGVFGRNVGNYLGAVDHLTAGIASMGKGAASVVGPLKNVTLGLKTMSATPAVAVLGILASVLQKVSEALKTSDANTDALAEAMAPLRAIGDAVTKVFQAMGSVLVSVVGWFGKLTTAILGTNKASEERLRLAKEQNALDEAQRQTIRENAEAERDIAELRAKASERDKYTATERMAFLEEAGKKEAEIAAREMANAKTRYELIRDRNALTQSSKEDMRAEAEAYADMVKAETNYYQSIRTINTGITRARREEAKAARDAAKAVKDAATAKLNAEKDYLSQLLSITKSGTDGELALQNQLAEMERDIAIADAKQKITDRKELTKALVLIEKSYQVQVEKNQQDHDNKVLAEELRTIANRRDTFQKGSVEYLAVQEEYAAMELDSLKRQMDETDAEYAARRLAAQRALKEAQNATQDAIIAEGALALQNEMNALREGSVEQFAKAVELAQYNLDNLYHGIDESDDAFLARRLEAQKAYREAVAAQNDAEVEAGRLQYEERLAALDEESLAYLDAEVALKKYELDTLHQLEDESEEEFRIRQLEADKAYYKAKKAQVKSWMDTLAGMASGVSSILGSIADAMEENTEMTKEEAQKAKNLRIAGATIDMLSGAVTAYAGAQSLGVPMGPIVGAINAAAVIATGIANIAKIKAQKISTDSSSSQSATVPAQVTAPTIEPQVQNVRNVTSASEEDRLNAMAGDRQVYILSSDLEADRNAQRVQVQETTF